MRCRRRRPSSTPPPAPMSTCRTDKRDANSSYATAMDVSSVRRRVVLAPAQATPTAQLKSARSRIERRKRDWMKRINYTNAVSVVVLPAAAALYVLVGTWPSWRTIVFSAVYFNLTLLAFSAGYHKYFAHNSFETNSVALQWFFVVFGSLLGLGPVRWWAALHRAHHQYTDDTERDPYSIKRGFLWTHWGWVVKKPKITRFYEEFLEHEFPLRVSLNEVLVDAVENDDFVALDAALRPNYNYALVEWQQRWYVACFVVTTLAVPLAVAWWLGDVWVHGAVYAGVLRMFVAQQAMLAAELACHSRCAVLLATQPFSDKNSSQNCHNPLWTIATYGQANQNYHHEFPHDYRNSSSRLAFDPTKWFIWSLYRLGFVVDLCKTPRDLITQLRLQQLQAVINRTKSQLNWGTPISKLPRITPHDFKRILASSNHCDRTYIVIQNIIHDITPFVEQHPGGVQLLRALHGKDATKAFFGGVYGHLTAATNLLATMRIGILDLGNEEEVWRRIHTEEADHDERQLPHHHHQSAEAA